MPTVRRDGPYRFFFYSNEYSGAELTEPPHIHVESDSMSKTAKYWLSPVRLAKSRRFASHELTDIQSLVQEHRTELLEEWDARFGTQ
jgi:hypothetical protein